MLAKRGFYIVVLEGDRSGQIGSQDFFHPGIHLALIALCVLLLRPESDGDHLFRLALRHEGQDLQKPRLLLCGRVNSTMRANMTILLS